MQVEPVVFKDEKEKAQESAQPLVTEKIYKKLDKLMRASVEHGACTRGVKAVTKALRKNFKGSASKPVNLNWSLFVFKDLSHCWGLHACGHHRPSASLL